MNQRFRFPAARRLSGMALALLLPVRFTAQAQQARVVDRAVLERLLVAEDARGKGAGALAPITEGLTSQDTLIRRVAVRAVGRLQRPDLAGKLIPILSDPVPAIRAEAAIAVAQSLRRVRRGAPPTDSTELSVAHAQLALDEAIGKESNATVAGAMAEALGRLSLGDSVAGRTAEQAILSAARSRLNFGFAHGLYWLAATRRFTGGLSQPAIALLRTTARSARDTTLRRMAVLALGTGGYLDSATVTVASRDPDEQVRRLALAGAADLSPVSRAGLVRRALADPSVMVRVAAIAAARVGSPSPDCAPIIRATGEPHPYVVLTAIDALGAACADSASAAVALVSIINRPTSPSAESNRGWQPAAHAIAALSKVDPARASALLERFTASGRWQDRLYAAMAATNLSDTPALLRLAGDRDHNVREAAIAGLSTVRKHETDSVYIAGLSSEGFQVVLAASEALAGSRHPGALPALLDGFDHVSAKRSENARDPRLSMLKRIGELGSAADTARLMPYLADFDTTVAMTTATILSRWSGAAVQAHPVPLPIAPEPLAAIFLNPRLRLHVTMSPMSGGGSFTLRLFPEEAPATVARIIRLASRHYYDGHVFQRVEPNFVIQGGGPDASEYVGDATFMRDEVGFHSHFRGTAGISSRGRDTGDAQLFLNLVDNYLLDHEYTVFGQVVDGLPVMDQILEGDVIESVEVVGGT